MYMHISMLWTKSILEIRHTLACGQHVPGLKLETHQKLHDTTENRTSFSTAHYQLILIARHIFSTASWTLGDHQVVLPFKGYRTELELKIQADEWSSPVSKNMLVYSHILMLQGNKVARNCW